MSEVADYKLVRNSTVGASLTDYRDNIEEAFSAVRVSGNGQGYVSTPYASFHRLNPLPGAGEEADESLRELYIDAPAARNPLDELFGKP